MENEEKTQAQKDADLVTYWNKEVNEALQREKKYREEARKYEEMYEAEKQEDNQFNILYSNTETLSPALYNSVPRPVVERRFKDEDKLGAMAAKAGARTLEYLIDDGLGEYASFDDLMKSSVLEALVVGRGVTRFEYDATTEKVPVESIPDMEEAKTPEVEEGRDPAAETYDRVNFETVCGKEVPWDRFLHGYAKKWKDVPWVGYLHFMTKDELNANFGEVGGQVPVATLDREDDEPQKKAFAGGDLKVATVYEIWDKASRKVIFFSPAYMEVSLKHVDDPLGLSGFFNCPKPLAFFTKISSLTPVPLYKTYAEQAKELNRTTIRITKVLNAMKVRGFYDGTVNGLEALLSAEDNVLLPAENVAALDQRGGLEKAIWLFPIEKLVGVLQQLYVARQQIKQVIYEITGIADIMRGSSQASETLGAQEIKNQWGTLRLKRNQKEVARYARDCLRIMLEIAVTKLSPDTLKAMTGLPYPTGEEKQQAQMMVQQVQQQTAGLPPDQIPPPVQQQIQQVSQMAAEPSWDEVQTLLQNDIARSFRIDIETNSTVDAEATEDKQNIAELLNAISQFLNGVSPLVESGSMPFEIASGMLLAIVRRFRFGPELEDQLKQMKAPEPKPDPKVESDKQKGQLELQKMQLDIEAQRQAQAQTAQLAQLEFSLAQQEHAMKMQELDRKAAFSAAQHQQKMATLRAQAIATAMKPAPAPSPTKA